MKKGSGFFLTALFLAGFVSSAYAEKVELMASNMSDRYHVSTCKVAKKLWPEEIIRFNSPEEAIAAGLNPCKKCYPPTSSKKSD